MRELVRTDSGRLSLTKVWSFIGCAVSTWVIIMLTMRDKMTWEFFLAYLGTVGGFSQISKWLSYRYGVKTDVATTTQTDADAEAIAIKKCNDCPASGAVKPKSEPEESGD